MQQWQLFIKNFSPENSVSPAEHTNCIADLSQLGLLAVTGQDAKQFLQGQLTCDIEDISSTQSRLGAHCNPQGRIISLFRLFFYSSNYYLQMPREMVPTALNALKKYAVFFKVTLNDASDSLICIGYAGDQLKNVVETLPENINDAITTNDLLIIKTADSPAPRYEIFGAFLAISTLWEKLAKQTTFVSAEAWKYSDIQAGIPAVYPETSGKLLPHDINLHNLNAISFKKGCYTGQEIIARMHIAAN